MNWRKQSCRYADIPYPTTDVQVFQELSVTAPVVCHYRLHRLDSPARRRGIKCSFDYSRRYFFPGTRSNETTSLKSCRYAITRSIDNGPCLPWFHSALSSVPIIYLIVVANALRVDGHKFGGDLDNTRSPGTSAIYLLHPPIGLNMTSSVKSCSASIESWIGSFC